MNNKLTKVVKSFHICNVASIVKIKNKRSMLHVLKNGGNIQDERRKSDEAFS